MSVREYIGARYVPVFADPAEWDATRTYEPLTVVTYQGNSYTSRQAVPANIPITNTTYWAQTGNYNAQVEQYRQEVATFDGRIDELEGTVSPYTSSSTIQSAINSAVNSEATARQNADTLLSNRITDFITSGRYIICIGNSWVAPSGQPDGGYGNDLQSWLNRMYGLYCKVYGRGGAGWLRTGPNSGETISAAVTEAINDVANDGEAARCTDIFLLEMQNDQEYFNSGTPAGYVDIINNAVTSLKERFPLAKIHYIMDNAKSTTYAQYNSFNLMLRNNFNFSPIHTAYYIKSNGYRDTAHLANNVDGYGMLAKLMMSEVVGSNPEIPWITFTSTSSNKFASFDYFSTKGDPYKGIVGIRTNFELDASAIQSNDYKIPLSLTDTYLNTNLLLNPLSNYYFPIKFNLSYLNFKDVHVTTGANLWLAPEMLTWITTTPPQNNLRFVGCGVAEGLYA